MLVSFDTSAFQFVDEHVDRSYILIPSDDHTVDLEVITSERVNEPQNLQVVGDAKIMARLVGRNIASINTDDDFYLFLQLLQELDLRIFIKSWKNSHGVFVVNQFAAEFKIQPLCISLVNPLQNKLRLFLYVFLRIKTFFQHDSSHCNFILTAASQK